LSRRSDEYDSLRDVRVVVAPEIIGAQEQEYASAGLVADAGRLLGADALRQQQTRFSRTRWGDDHPALLLFGNRPVLDDRKAEHSDVKGQRLVVVANDQSH